MADLTKIPTVPPPPGVRPNFVDPVKNEGRVVEIVVAFTVISMIFMALRLSTRYFISHALGLDDVLALFAMFTAIICAAFIFVLLHYGLGTHLWDVSVARSTKFLYYLIIHSIFVTIGPYLVKLSMLALYLRIFSARRTFRRILLVSIALIVVLATTLLLLQVLQCIPLDAIWTFQIESSRCLDIPLLQFVTTVANAITDLYILLLPLPILWRLQLPLRKKIGVTAIFTSGGIATAVAFVRVAVRSNFRAVSRDVTWTVTEWSIWFTIEINVGIAAACMPALQPLLRTIATHTHLSGGSRTLAPYPARSETYKPKKKLSSLWSSNTTRIPDNSSLEMGTMGLNETTIRAQSPATDEPSDESWSPQRDRAITQEGILHTVHVDVSSDQGTRR